MDARIKSRDFRDFRDLTGSEPGCEGTADQGLPGKRKPKILYQDSRGPRMCNAGGAVLGRDGGPRIPARALALDATAPQCKPITRHCGFCYQRPDYRVEKLQEVSAEHPQQTRTRCLASMVASKRWSVTRQNPRPHQQKLINIGEPWRLSHTNRDPKRT
jgi:hypothetical protein